MELTLLQLLLLIGASTVLLSAIFLVAASIITAILTLLRFPSDLNDIEISSPKKRQ
jgi:uncharacterized membrane protein